MSDLNVKPGSGRVWIWIILSLVILAAVIVLLFDAEDTADVTKNADPAPLMTVTVIDVAAQSVRSQVSAYSELRPRWNSEIRAAVSGRVVHVFDDALAGQRVKTGASLFSIEKTRYETAIASGELALEQAKLELWRAQNGVTLARRRFKREGVKPPNDLALGLPELRIAERAVTHAKTQLAAARQQLADTDVVAPFSGFVTQRMVSLGQTVAAGEPLVRLADDSRFELILELNEADWSLLAHPIAAQQAILLHRDGTRLGSATVRQGGGFLDSQTRQRRIFMEIVDPGEGVLAGDFVQVVMEGRTIDNTLTVPETSLTREGYIWMIDAESLLVRHTPKILFRRDDQIVMVAPEGAGPWRVATTPLASFLNGQRVSPHTPES